MEDTGMELVASGPEKVSTLTKFRASLKKLSSEKALQKQNYDKKKGVRATNGGLPNLGHKGESKIQEINLKLVANSLQI